jgi:transposase-like protein
MKNNTDTSTLSLLANEAGYDPIEDRLRENVRATIEAVFEEELDAFLGRCRYDRGTDKPKGYRHGHRERQLIGTFGTDGIRPDPDAKDRWLGNLGSAYRPNQP